MQPAGIETILQALSSPNQCTPEIVLQLRLILSGDGGDRAKVAVSALDAKPTKNRPYPSSSRANASDSKQSVRRVNGGTSKGTSSSTQQSHAPSLSRSEKIKVASLVFNAGLRTLSINPEDKPSERKALRHVSPNKGRARTTKTSGGTKATTQSSPSDVSSVAECTCQAINLLIECRPGKSADFRLENGLISLISKLLARSLYKLAWAQVLVLHRTLECDISTPKRSGEAGLLYFNELNLSTLESTTAAVNYQELALRVLMLNPARIPSQALPGCIPCPYPWAPENVLRKLLDLSEDVGRAHGHARNVSQVMLHLASASLPAHPALAFEVQAVALGVHLLVADGAKETSDIVEGAWKFFEHSIAKLGQQAYKDRDSTAAAIGGYEILHKRADECSCGEISKIHEGRIHRLLAELCEANGEKKQAISWLEKAKALQPSKLELCGLMAKQVALDLQALSSNAPQHDIDVRLRDALSLLDGQMTGSIAEFAVAVRDTVALRKAVVEVLRSLGDSNRPTSRIVPTLCDILRYCIKFLHQFLGSTPKDSKGDDPSNYQKALDVVSDLAKVSVESALFGIRKSETIQDAEVSGLSSMLGECNNLLSRLRSDQAAGYQTTGFEHAAQDKLAVAISNAYWTLATKNEHRLQPEELVELMQRSCQSMGTLNPDAQEAGNLCLKLYRLGRSLQRHDMIDASRQAYERGVQACIRTGVLATATSMASQDSFHLLLSSEQCRILNTLLKSLIDIASVKTEVVEAFFDDGSLATDTRGTLLEWQLDLLLARKNKTFARTPAMHTLSARTVNVLRLELYPLRRIRVLSKLLRFAAIDEGAEIRDLLKQARETANAPRNSDALAADRGLARFQTHLEASLLAQIAVLDRSESSRSFEKAMELWRSLCLSSKSPTDLASKIDDIDAWITQLDVLSAYFGMNGLDSQRLCTLTMLERAHGLIEGPQQPGLPSRLLNSAEQLLRMGYAEKAAGHLSRCRKLLDDDTQVKNSIQASLACLGSDCALSLHTDSKKSRQILNDFLSSLNAEICASKAESSILLTASRLCQSIVRSSISNGSPFDALLFAKRTVLLLQRAWRQLQHSQTSRKAPPEEGERVEDDHTSASPGRAQSIGCGPQFWPLLPKLVSALLQVASLSKKFGYLQDAHSATEQAQRLASEAGSEFLVGQVLIEQGDSACRSGATEVGRQHFVDAMAHISSMAVSRGSIYANESFGYFSHLAHEWTAELSAYSRAEEILKSLLAPDFIDSLLLGHDTSSVVEASLSKLSLREAEPAASARTTKKPRQKTAALAKNKTVDIKTSRRPEILREFDSLASDLNRRRADSLVAQEELEEALSILESLTGSRGGIEESALVDAAFGDCLLQQSLSLMASDTVFNMLPDSAISLPAIRQTDPCSRTTNASRSQARTKEYKRSASPKSQPSTSDFRSSLNSALARLAGVSAAHAQHCSNFTISRLSGLCATSLLVRAFVGGDSEQDEAHNSTAVARCIEFPRNIAAERERNAIVVSNAVKDISPTASLTSKPTLVQRNFECETFQSDFVDIIPPAWTAVSITLTDDHKYLYVVRYDSGVAPFVLRLPLSRQHAEESMDESLTFEEAKNEILGIIASSDDTIERAKGGEVEMSLKTEKSKWWSEREALDTRLRDLLVNMENLWLGGFRSIFAACRPDATATTKFEEAFVRILDTHLPSRGQQKGTQREQKLAIDPRIFELFVGLENPSSDEVDLYEPLTDLLYFVVDVLQFNGERNAYDEIDFDAMLVETQDALRAYHRDAARDDSSSASHLILILDKPLHVFPWESMPCLDGRAVSRLPSLLDLHDRVHLMREQNPHGAPGTDRAGITLSATHGTYILNPSRDLPKTQARFEAPLSSSPLTFTWARITARAPTEPEFATALTWPPSAPHPPVLLYIGHGSGAQYIRSKTVRRLTPRCGAALLFGCSSAALRPAGQFEPLGVPKNYVVAGAPAVAGALWDVTDGDCDGFAAGVLRRWGVLAPDARVDGTKGRRRREKKEGGAAPRPRTKAPEGRLSLDEAVAVSRGECYLKYLNGAAMVVYGVPCYLGE